jgi:hypothetical protein
MTAPENPFELVSTRVPPPTNSTKWRTSIIWLSLKQLNGAPGGIRLFASLTCRIRTLRDLDESRGFAELVLVARRAGLEPATLRFASELCSRCASPAKLAREEESQPEEDQ